MSNGFYNVPIAVNEPVKSYAPGSAERKELLAQYKRMYNTSVDVTMYIGDNKIFTKDKTKSTIANFKIGTCFLSNILYEYTNILNKYNDLLKRVENIESYINDGGYKPGVS